MKTIWKYTLPLQSRFEFDLPFGAIPLSVGIQTERMHDIDREVVRLWVAVDAGTKDFQRRHFCVLGTGHELPEPSGRFLGTVLLNGGDLVLHIFLEDLP